VARKQDTAIRRPSGRMGEQPYPARIFDSPRWPGPLFGPALASGPSRGCRDRRRRTGHRRRGQGLAGFRTRRGQTACNGLARGTSRWPFSSSLLEALSAVLSTLNRNPGLPSSRPVLGAARVGARRIPREAGDPLDAASCVRVRAPSNCWVGDRSLIMLYAPCDATCLLRASNRWSDSGERAVYSNLASPASPSCHLSYTISSPNSGVTQRPVDKNSDPCVPRREAKSHLPTPLPSRPALLTPRAISPGRTVRTTRTRPPPDLVRLGGSSSSDRGGGCAPWHERLAATPSASMAGEPARSRRSRRDSPTGQPKSRLAASRAVGEAFSSNRYCGTSHGEASPGREPSEVRGGRLRSRHEACRSGSRTFPSTHLHGEAFPPSWPSGSPDCRQPMPPPPLGRPDSR